MSAPCFEKRSFCIKQGQSLSLPLPGLGGLRLLLAALSLSLSLSCAIDQIVQMSTYSTQRGTAPRSLSRVGSRTMPLGGMGMGRRAHRPLLRGNCSAAPSTRFVDHGSLLQQHIAERHERSHGD